MAPTQEIPYPGTTDAADTREASPEDLDEARRRAADPRMIPWVGLRSLRQRGLLEGDAFDEVWTPMVRDTELGKLLFERYGVVVGADGDRLYLRRLPRGEARAFAKTMDSESQPAVREAT